MTVGNMKGETIVINTAFLQGDFEERIFMEVPTGIMPNFLENTVRNGTQVFVGEKLIIGKVMSAINKMIVLIGFERKLLKV
jgi:hypothetical protein